MDVYWLGYCFGLGFKEGLMKKIILFTLLAIVSLNLKATAFNIWYIENDTATAGQSFKVYVKGSYSAMDDTGRVYIKNLTTASFVEVYKVSLVDLIDLGTPSGPSGTYELTFNMPTSGYTGPCEMFSNHTSMPRLPVFMRSNTPDFSVVGGYGAFNGPSGFATQFKVKWTYQALITDSLELNLDGILFKKIALTDLQDDSIVTFNISGSPGVHPLTANYVLNSGTWIDFTINTVAGIIDFIELEKTNSVQYYNISGIEIKKPSEGFFIWKSGLDSGKVYIMQ